MAKAAKKTASKTPPKAVKKPSVEDEEEDEEVEAEAVPNPAYAFYDPTTHTCVPTPTYDALVSAKITSDRGAALLLDTETKRSETQFMGFQTNVSMLQEQLASEREYGRTQRDEVERQRTLRTKAEMELSDMVRQTEDAKLERERLKADVERGRMSLQKFELELDARLRQKQAELDAVRQVSAPVFAVAAQGVGRIIAEYGAAKIPGLAAAASAVNAAANQPQPDQPGQVRPSARSGANGTETGTSSAPMVQLNPNETDVFKTAVLDVFNTLQPRSLACLRAVVCSHALPGAPPVPKIVGEVFMGSIFADAGEERVMALFRAAGRAYIADEEKPAVTVDAVDSTNAAGTSGSVPGVSPS